MCPFRRLKQSAKSLYVNGPSGVFQMRGWIFFSVILELFVLFIILYSALSRK